jgi:hypothetical protein
MPRKDPHYLRDTSNQTSTSSEDEGNLDTSDIADYSSDDGKVLTIGEQYFKPRKQFPPKEDVPSESVRTTPSLAPPSTHSQHIGGKLHPNTNRTLSLAVYPCDDDPVQIAVNVAEPPKGVWSRAKRKSSDAWQQLKGQFNQQQKYDAGNISNLESSWSMLSVNDHAALPFWPTTDTMSSCIHRVLTRPLSSKVRPRDRFRTILMYKADPWL